MAVPVMGSLPLMLNDTTLACEGLPGYAPWMAVPS